MKIVVILLYICLFSYLLVFVSLYFRILFRIYWFPTKILHSSGVVSMVIFPNGPFYLSFNIMLFLLYCMQVYWFGFIVVLLIRLATGTSKVADTREYEEDG